MKKIPLLILIAGLFVLVLAAHVQAQSCQTQICGNPLANGQLCPPGPTVGPASCGSNEAAVCTPDGVSCHTEIPGPVPGLYNPYDWTCASPYPACAPATTCTIACDGPSQCGSNQTCQYAGTCSAACVNNPPPVCTSNTDCGGLPTTNLCTVSTPTCNNQGKSDAYCSTVTSPAPSTPGGWSAWSNAAEQCGTRTCTNPLPSCGPTCSGPATASCNNPVNGECSDVAGQCAAGTAINVNTESCETAWSCQGTDGGTTAQCLPVTAAPVNGTWNCTTGACDGNSCGGTCTGTEAQACSTTPPPTCSANTGQSCPSAPNSCGEVGLGTVACDGSCVGAVTPPPSSCGSFGVEPSYIIVQPSPAWCTLGGTVSFTANFYETQSAAPEDITEHSDWLINPIMQSQGEGQQQQQTGPYENGPSQDVSLGNGEFACDALGGNNNVTASLGPQTPLVGTTLPLSEGGFAKFNVAGVLPSCPATMQAGTTAKCTVKVYGSDGNVYTQANWSVPPGDGSFANSANPQTTGKYTAPSTPGYVTVTATSLINPSVSGTAIINITSGTTQSCGGNGQSCCTTGNSCNGSLSCNTTTNTCGTGVGGPGNTASLSAQPSSGPEPLSTTLTATVSGTIVGFTINYSLWWNCPHNNDITVAEAKADCGALPNAPLNSCISNATGMKCNSISSSITTESTSTTYTSAGTYHPKVIIETGAPAVEAHTSVSVTQALSVSPPSITAPIGSPTTPITATGGCSGSYTWSVSPSTGVTAPSWSGASFDPTFTTPGTYQVTVTDSCGGTKTSVVTATQPSCTFSANPTSVTPPQPSNLEWYCLNATSCTLADEDGNNIPINSTVNGNTYTLTGSTMVTPYHDTVYTLTCSGGPHDSVTQNSSVGVSGPGIIETNP